MEIVKHELKKIFTAPIVLIALVVILSFNGLVIFSNTHIRGYMSVVTDFAQTSSTELTPSTIAIWQEQAELSLLNANDLAGTDYADPSYFFDNHAIWTYSQEVVDSFWLAQQQFYYIEVATNTDELFKTQMDMTAHSEMVVSLLGATGTLAELIEQQYQLASLRVDEVFENGDYNYLFFSGNITLSLSFLINAVVRGATIGSIILGVLITAHLLCFEFEQKTYLITYTTKIGRKLQVKKLIASLIATTIIYTVVMSLTLLLYFSVYNYSSLWQTPMHSIFMNEQQFLALFWYDFNFWQYLLSMWVVLLGLQFIVVLMIFTLSKFFKNSYLLGIVFIITMAVIFMIPDFIPRSSSWLLYATFNPTTILFSLQNTFQVDNLFPHFEKLTLGIWTIGLAISGYITQRQFKKGDIL